MLRNVGAVLLGMFVGGIANMALIVVAAVIWPMPDGAMEDPEKLRAYIGGLPVAALLLTMVAHLAQAGLGGWIAARVGNRPVVLALIIGVLTAFGTAYTLNDLGGPMWMAIELPFDLLLAGAVGYAEQQRRVG